MIDFSGFTDTPDQADLRGVLRDFLSQHGTPAKVRQAVESPAGYDEAAWKRITGDLGLTALAVPEDLGGAGATLAEVAVAAQEIARVLLPVPYLSTALTAAILCEAAGPAAEQFLPGLIDGTLTGALAFGPGVTTFSGGRLSGTVRNVIDGARAGLFLVRASGALVAVRASDAAVTPVGTLDQTRSQATVAFRDTPALRVSPDNGHNRDDGESGRADDGAGAGEDGGAFADRAEDLVRAFLAAESAAAAVQCLNTTVEYLKTRVQFGRPIGEFQALKHRCADLAVAAESAWMTAHAAIGAAVSDPAEFRVAAPLAKRYCADAFFTVAAETIQLHGGIGFTWEHDAHLYFKRAKSTQLLHGTSAELRQEVARRAALLGLWSPSALLSQRKQRTQARGGTGWPWLRGGRRIRVLRVNREFDLPAVLTELLYGDESTEPLERTLDRLVTPDFVQRINGQVYRRPEYAAHVREMRQLVAGGGEMQVLEQVGTDTAIAGRYLFRMEPAAGQSLTFESHLFARIADGRVERMVEVARQTGDGDNQDLLTGP